MKENDIDRHFREVKKIKRLIALAQVGDNRVNKGEFKALVRTLVYDHLRGEINLFEMCKTLKDHILVISDIQYHAEKFIWKSPYGNVKNPKKYPGIPFYDSKANKLVHTVEYEISEDDQLWETIKNYFDDHSTDVNKSQEQSYIKIDGYQIPIPTAGIELTSGLNDNENNRGRMLLYYGNLIYNAITFIVNNFSSSYDGEEDAKNHKYDKILNFIDSNSIESKGLFIDVHNLKSEQIGYELRNMINIIKSDDIVEEKEHVAFVAITKALKVQYAEEIWSENIYKRNDNEPINIIRKKYLDCRDIEYIENAIIDFDLNSPLKYGLEQVVIKAANRLKKKREEHNTFVSIFAMLVFFISGFIVYFHSATDVDKTIHTHNQTCSTTLSDDNIAQNFDNNVESSRTSKQEHNNIDKYSEETNKTSKEPNKPTDRLKVVCFIMGLASIVIGLFKFIHLKKHQLTYSKIKFENFMQSRTTWFVIVGLILLSISIAPKDVNLFILFIYAILTFVGLILLLAVIDVCLSKWTEKKHYDNEEKLHNNWYWIVALLIVSAFIIFISINAVISGDTPRIFTLLDNGFDSTAEHFYHSFWVLCMMISIEIMIIMRENYEKKIEEGKNTSYKLLIILVVAAIIADLCIGMIELHGDFSDTKHVAMKVASALLLGCISFFVGKFLDVYYMQKQLELNDIEQSIKNIQQHSSEADFNNIKIENILKNIETQR